MTNYEFITKEISGKEYNNPNIVFKLIKVIVKIKNNNTGEVRKFEDELNFDEETNTPSTWMWEEGNYSCDCNRSLFFNRAGNEDDGNHECSEGEFSANIYNIVDNSLIYEEFGENQ